MSPIPESWLACTRHGIAWMDADHHGLLDTLDRLAQALLDGQQAAALRDTLAFLADYRDRHFGTEEERMQRLGYPETEAHLRAHATFRHLCDDFSQRLDDDTTQGKMLLADDLRLELTDWLLGHIGNTDRHLAAFLREHDTTP